VICDIAHLRTLNPALRRRVLRLAFQQLSGTLEGVNLRHIDAIIDLIDSARPNSRLALPHRVAVVREYDFLMFSRLCDAASDADFELLISAPGCYQLSTGGSVTVELASSASATRTADSTCFDLAKTPLPWLVRPFRPGDRITPFGMSGRKKVKDIFIDRKIPLSERKQIPLLFCGEDLIWIVGVCVSELSRVDVHPDVVVKVTWNKSGWV
jgi:tRNA(Ile)-lysidine synthase